MAMLKTDATMRAQAETSGIDIEVAPPTLGSPRGRFDFYVHARRADQDAGYVGSAWSNTEACAFFRGWLAATKLVTYPVPVGSTAHV